MHNFMDLFYFTSSFSGGFHIKTLLLSFTIVLKDLLSSPAPECYRNHRDSPASVKPGLCSDELCVPPWQLSFYGEPPKKKPWTPWWAQITSCTVSQGQMFVSECPVEYFKECLHLWWLCQQPDPEVKVRGNCCVPSPQFKIQNTSPGSEENGPTFA